MDEAIIGRKAVKAGIISQAQFEECLELQKKMRKIGVAVRPLHEILDMKGYIHKEEWSNFQQSLDQDLLDDFMSVSETEMEMQIAGPTHERKPEQIEKLFPELLEKKPNVIGEDSSLPSDLFSDLSSASALPQEQSCELLYQNSTNKNIASSDTVDTDELITDPLFIVDPDKTNLNSEYLFVDSENSGVQLLSDHGKTDSNSDLLSSDPDKTDLSSCSIFSDPGEKSESADPLFMEDLEKSDEVDAQSYEQQQTVAASSFPTIDGYKILEELGKGAMGRVYKAMQLSMDRMIAIKVLDKKLSQDYKIVERFIREARTTARLTHENIITGIDAGTTKDGVHYFVMEFVEGESLECVLEREKKLKVNRAIDIIIQVADALDYAHKEGIIHRDIKPDNIMISPDGIPKLCDLGLARIESGNSRLTMEGTALGTPYYISPEQARGLANIDNRSDIYSLGTTLYHITTGSVPFPQSNPAVVCAMHATKSFPDPRSFDEELPDELCEIIDKCTEKKPEKRYQTCAEIVTDLDELLHLLKTKRKKSKKSKKPTFALQEEFELVNEEPLPPVPVSVAVPIQQEESPLGFADEEDNASTIAVEETSSSPTRRRRRRYRQGSVQVRKASIAAIAARKETSKAWIYIAVFCLILAIGVSGYLVYINLPDKSGPKKGPVIKISKEKKLDPQTKIALAELKKLIDKSGLLDVNSKTAIPNLLKKYDKLFKQYKFSVEAGPKIKDALMVFRSRFNKRAESAYQSRIKRTRGFEKIFEQDNDPYQLTKAYEDLKGFPLGLYWTKKGKRIKNQAQQIKEKIIREYNREKEDIQTLRNNKKYRKALVLCEKVAKYVLREQQTEVTNLKSGIQSEYENYKNQSKVKYWLSFRKDIDSKIMEKKYQQALLSCKKYQGKKFHGFKDYVDEEIVRLKALIEAHRYTKRKNLKPKSFTSTRKEILKKLSGTSKSYGDWIMGILYMNGGLWEKAQDALNEVDEELTKNFKKTIKKQLLEEKAEKLFTLLKKQKQNKQFKVAWQDTIPTFLKLRQTEFFKANKEQFRSEGRKLKKLYLEEYALFLYFQQPFTSYNRKTHDFSIEYAFDSAEQLEDFKGTIKKAKIKNGRLLGNPGRGGVFELYWQGETKGEIDISAKISATSEPVANLGLYVYKKGHLLENLDKYAFLLKFNLKKFALHEILQKDPLGEKRIKKLKNTKFKTFDASQAIICHMEGKPSRLQYLSYESKLKKFLLKKDVAPLNVEEEITMRIHAKNRGIKCEGPGVSLEFNRSELSKGFVGLYANSPMACSQFIIKGKLDSKWIKKIKALVLKRENQKTYLKRKFVLPGK